MHTCRRSRETLSRFGYKREIPRIHGVDTSSSTLSISSSDSAKNSCRTPETVASCERLAVVPERKKERKQAEQCSKKHLSRDSRHFPMLLSCPPRVYRSSSVIGDWWRSRGIAKDLRYSSCWNNLFSCDAHAMSEHGKDKEGKRNERKRESRHAEPEIRSMTPRET